MRTIGALLLLACASSVFAGSTRPDQTYERVLIPVFISAPGAQGAQWETAVTLTSTADVAMQLARPVLLYPQDKSCGLTCVSRTLVERAVAGLPRELEHAAGLMLWVPRSVDRNDLHVNVRVHDAAKNATSAGTYVPLVREDDLTGNKMVLMDVPVGEGFRASLRLYDLYLSQTAVELEIYDMEQWASASFAEPLVSTTVELVSDPPATGTDEQYQLRPAFAFIGDLAAAYPQLAGHESVAIIVTGLHPLVSPPAYDKRFFALASATNNATNEVTIIAPR